MSFSSKVKDELCKNSRSNDFIISQLYGILLFSHSFKSSNISVYNENKNICELVKDMIIKNFECIVDLIFINNNKTILEVPDENDRIKILEKFGHKPNEINLKINKKILKSNNDIKLFLSGAFMSCGTITNPNNGYHLEFSIPFMNLSKDLYELLISIKNLKIKVKTTVRKGNFIIYIKDSEDITDFLAYIGASSSAMEMIQIKMMKEVRNYVNRTTNFETANMNKTANAAALQIEAINELKKKGIFSCLDDDLKELAQLRINNPDMSLRQLGENLSVPLTRSGVNHKIKKILNIYYNI